MLEHTKFALNGKGILKEEKVHHVLLDNARLDSSVFSFTLKFLVDIGKGMHNTIIDVADMKVRKD